MASPLNNITLELGIFLSRLNIDTKSTVCLFTYLINTARKRVSMNNDNMHKITLVRSVVAPSNLLKAIASDVP